jgi:hypothetical protein
MPLCDAAMNVFRNMPDRRRKVAAVPKLSRELSAKTKWKNWKTIAFSVEGISGKNRSEFASFARRLFHSD